MKDVPTRRLRRNNFGMSQERVAIVTVRCVRRDSKYSTPRIRATLRHIISDILAVIRNIIY